MSKYRYTAIIATVANSFCDTVLDYAVYKFNYYKVLFLTSIVAMLWQLGIGTVTEIKLSINISKPYLLSIFYEFNNPKGYLSYRF